MVILHGRACPCECCLAYRRMDREVWVAFGCLLVVGLVVLGVVWGLTL